MTMTPMLKFSDVELYYDHVYALKGVSIELNQGETVALLSDDNRCSNLDLDKPVTADPLGASTRGLNTLTSTAE